MAFGPEFVSGLVFDFEKSMPWRVSKIEGGEAWTAIKISEQWILFSWTSGAGGCCFASNEEISALKKLSPSRAPMAEALKSRLLRGGEIFSLNQINNDRVIEFKARRRVAAGLSVNYFLVLEVTEPVGNFILLNEERKIDEAARHSAPDQNHYRTILPGHLYVPPPEFNGINFSEYLKNAKKLKFEDVQNLKGIGRPLSRLIQTHWEERDSLSWHSAIAKIYEKNDKNIICQIIKKKNYLTRFDFLFPEADSLGNNISDAAAIGVLIPLLTKGREKKLHDIDSKLKRAVKSRERHRDGLLKQLKECEKAEIFRKKGEMILANINNIPAYSREVILSDWEGNELKIELEPNLTPSGNAKKYFKKYRKFKSNPDEIKNNLEIVNHAIKEIKEQHDLLSSINDPEEFDKAAEDVIEWLNPSENKNKNINTKRKKNISDAPPHSTFTRGDAIILVGLSARGNRYVTFKQARQDDIWLHAHEVPGAHVIIKNIRRNELENERHDILEFAASLAAGHSSGRSSGSVLVDYTERKYVRSVPGTVALVTYTNPGTIRVSPSK